MAVLIDEQIRLNGERYTSVPISLSAKTSRLKCIVDRPKAAGELTNWPETTVVLMRMRTWLDDGLGIDHECFSSEPGGIRLHPVDPLKFMDAELEWILQWGFWGRDTGFPTRMGEEGSQLRGELQIETLSGSINTRVRLISWEADAPRITFHRSVSFQSAGGSSGTGVTVSFSHTAAGTDRAAFIGVGETYVSDVTGTASYDSNASTNIWDQSSSQVGSAGYYNLEADVPTTSVTVSSTLDTDPLRHRCCVLILNGVHQTTPIGTAVASSGNRTNSSVDVTDAATDDLVVDMLACAASPTEGADQTIADTADHGSDPSYFRSSYQDGADGGVMSYTHSNGWAALGAVAFKPSEAAGGGNLLKHPGYSGGIKELAGGVSG